MMSRGHTPCWVRPFGFRTGASRVAPEGHSQPSKHRRQPLNCPFSRLLRSLSARRYSMTRTPSIDRTE
eukprot:5160578-Alexandrium_andersonii.AAC.1